MDTLDELLAEEASTYTNDELIVNADDRTIYVPNTLAGVFSDEKSTRLKFRCPKSVGDNVDLSAMNVYINFRNANGDIYSYLTDDVAVDGENITFSWLLSRDVTTYKGNVDFIICAKKIQSDGKIAVEWNTTLATLTVLEGLEPADNYIPTEKVDVATELMNAVNTLTEEVNGIKNTIPVVPTKVSQLENDKNYLTAVPEEYVTEYELNAHTNNTNIHVTTADKSNWNGKFDSNQGASNAGKLLGTNSNGDVVTIQGYGFEYDESTKMLKYGTDPTTNLNQGIGLDDTLSKKGYAADSASVGELKSDLENKCKRTHQLYDKRTGYVYMVLNTSGNIYNSPNKNGIIIIIPNLENGKRYVWRIDNIANALSSATYVTCGKQDTLPKNGDVSKLGTTVKGTDSVYGVLHNTLDGQYGLISFRFADNATLNQYVSEIIDKIVVAQIDSGYNVPYAEYLILNVEEDSLSESIKTDIKRATESKWKGKTIWWCGTSIPEGKGMALGSESNGKSYPEIVCDILGAKVVNNSLGSSMCRANTRTGDFVNANSYNITRSLTQTKEEKQDMIDNWDTYRSRLNDPNTYTSIASISSTVLGASFEERLMPYLDGTYTMPDLFVFDHGHNDWKQFYTKSDGSIDTALEPTVENIQNGELAEDTYMTANNNAKLIQYFGEIDKIPSAERANFIASVNRNCFKGAINFLVTLILSKNPRARILFIGNLDSWGKPEVIVAQKDISESWQFPLVKVWEKLGFSNHYIPNTYNFWNNGGTTDLMMKQIYCKDGVHPHSDTTGKAIEYYSYIISREIDNIV